MELESRLIPILREGIDIIKMIFFKKLKDHLAQKYPGSDPAYIAGLAGAIINNLFGTLNDKEPFATFALNNKARIEKELGALAGEFEELRIPLTDALRMQALCDHQEGRDTSSVLQNANALGLLLTERDMPLPHSFLHLVRKLGSAFGLIVPPAPQRDRTS